MQSKRPKIKPFLSLILIICTAFSFFGTKAFADSSYTVTSTPTCKCTSSLDTEVSSRFKELIFGKKKTEDTSHLPTHLCPGGDAFGIKIEGGSVTVSQVIGELSSGALRENDVITKIDGVEIFSIEDVKEMLASFKGGELSFEIRRDGKTLQISLEPRQVGNEYHLGVILTDGATGIGTITYYDNLSGNFGGLGHGICEKESGKLIEMSRGYATGVILAGASKPSGTHPGELRGVLTDRTIGSVDANTECGVFGKLDLTNNIKITQTEPIEVAKKSEVHKGEAIIYSTIKSGKRAEYTIIIDDIDYSSTGTKSFRIKVTDPALISLSGGIVRGMSGSPIIQDGRLVGAVTHVLVADPTEGYGIFIENMLNASQEARNELPKAA